MFDVVPYPAVDAEALQERLNEGLQKGRLLTVLPIMRGGATKELWAVFERKEKRPVIKDYRGFGKDWQDEGQG